MNEVTVKIDPYDQVNEFTVNGRGVSPYSELNNFVKRPFILGLGSISGPDSGDQRQICH